MTLMVDAQQSQESVKCQASVISKSSTYHRHGGVKSLPWRRICLKQGIVALPAGWKQSCSEMRSLFFAQTNVLGKH